MSEEDYDDELPSISSNVFSNDLKDFSMPPADVLASQRAHQEQCEQELQQLRSHYEKLETEGWPVLQAGDSSSSDSEASLSAPPGPPQPPPPRAPAAIERIAVVERLANALCDCDTTFLSSYLQVLHSNDENFIRAVSQEMVSDIECAYINGKDGNSGLSGADAVVLCGWLSAASVWGPAPVPVARRLLQAILGEQSTETVDAVGAALGSALAGAGPLVRASDAALGPAPQHRRLARRLLAAALDALAPPPSPPPPPPPAPAPATAVSALCERLRPVWRRLEANEQRAALLLAGRVAARAAGGLGAGDREALRQFLALVLQAPPAGHRHTPEHFKVLVAASKLQTVFGVNM